MFDPRDDGMASEKNSAQWMCGESGCFVGSYKRARMCVLFRTEALAFDD